MAKYYSPSIFINAPVLNAIVPGSFSVSGTASCDLLEDKPGEPGTWVRTANQEITSVRVSLGTAAPVNATPTGPSGTPWTSWTFPVSGRPSGPLSITVEVTASGSAGLTGTDTASRPVTVDANPPTFTINPPADVVQPAPPYIATITGAAADSPAGVAAVEWQFGGAAWQAATGTTNWTAQAPLPGLGLHTVSFRARDNMGNLSATQTTQVRVGDFTAPSLSITEPQAGDAFPLVNGQVTIVARGVASDTQTGVAKVEWSLDGQTGFTQATPKAANDWSTWTAQVPITTAGNRTITVRAMDKATPSNTYQLQCAFVVTEPFQPQDPEAVFSPAAYLDDLLNYSTQRAKTSATGTLITRQLLVDTYLQPFIDLVTRANRTVANQSASQVRLCIEVLRRYLSKNGSSVPAAAEAAYRQAAYGALLQQLSTSYDEIRLARVADASARAALASRLGIAVTQFRPDRLDQLLLQPADLTEIALKNLFGLEETTVRPLADSLLPECNLLIWQKENLRSAWQQQDEAARSEMDLPAPVIDPDLLSAEDLRTPSSGNAAYDLWKARRDYVAAQLTALDTLRKTQPTQLSGFNSLMANAISSVAVLLDLLAQLQSGNSIDIQLQAKRLTMQAFLHLMRVRQLADANTMLDAEWNDVYAILIQVKKFALYATWRGEERQKGMILGPDYFQLSDNNQSLIEALHRWRATPQARQAWRRTLGSRMEQELTLTQTMQSVVSAAEQAALPMLRDACIAAVAGARDVSVIADRLTQELGIDCKDSGHLRTTRAQQALETLQAVLLSLRTGRFKNAPPVLGTTNPAANWVLALNPSTYTAAEFDEEWRWIGGYTTWNAAMRVFAYPESYLLPELRPASSPTQGLVPTAAYQELMKGLRDETRLSAEKARHLAETYLHKLTDDLATLPPTLCHPTFVITEQLTDTQLVERRNSIRDTYFSGITNPSQAPNYLQEIFYFVPMALALQLQKSGQYLVALDWIETFYTDHFAAADRKIYRGLALEETIQTLYQRNPDNWLRVGLNPHEIAKSRANAHTRFTLMTLARCYLDFADAEFTRDDGESIARARALYGTALDLLALSEMQPPTGSAASPFPPNPVPQALKMPAELNPVKLRSGRNIAGIERQLTPLTQPALMLDRLPAASDAQRLFRPTPYRYGALIERAKNLVSIA